MDINYVWNKRIKEFYSEIIRYFSVITMSVVYSFIIFGAPFCIIIYSFSSGYPHLFQLNLLQHSLLLHFS